GERREQADSHVLRAPGSVHAWLPAAGYPEPRSPPISALSRGRDERCHAVAAGGGALRAAGAGRLGGHLLRPPRRRRGEEGHRTAAVPRRRDAWHERDPVALTRAGPGALGPARSGLLEQRQL